MSTTEVDATDKLAALLGKREADIREVELPTLGFSVKVRGLTRSEALAVVGKEMSPAEAERKLISRAMVDPRMTEDQVRQWQKVAPAGELKPVEEAVKEMSGLGATSVKEAVAGFPDGDE